MSICVQSIGFVTAKLKKAVRSPREAREKDFGVKLDGVGKAFCVLYGTTDKAGGLSNPLSWQAHRALAEVWRARSLTRGQ